MYIFSIYIILSLLENFSLILVSDRYSTPKQELLVLKGKVIVKIRWFNLS